VGDAARGIDAREQYFVRRIFLIVALSLLALLLALYTGDYLVLRYRMAKNRNPFGTVTISRYYVIQEKANKIEYVFLDSRPETCVHALFPHVGDLPCWYLNGHTERKIEI
jgi:hypothetical protein